MAYEDFAERCFVMVKPDGVQRGLVGECIKRLEQTGLKLIAVKMVHPTKQLVEKHYPSSDEWLTKVGNKTLTSAKEAGVDVSKKFGTDKPLEIGKAVKKMLVNYISSGPVVAMIWEGYKARDNVAKIAGDTKAVKAEAGSIRGMYSIDDPLLGNMMNRPINNVIHSSREKEEADNEIKLWFKPEEMFKYKRCDEDVFYKEW